MQLPPCPIAELRVGEIPLVEYTLVCNSILPLILRFANFIILSHIYNFLMIKTPPFG